MTESPGLLVTPYEVLEWVWCPRFIYYWKCLGVPQYEERRYKVERGREVHEEREKKPVGTRRERLAGAVLATDAELESPRLGLRGKVDEVLRLDDGSLAPIDFKFTEPREFTFETHRVQLCLYALLVEDVLATPVTRGWIAYVRGANQFHDVEFDRRLRSRTRRALDATLDIIQHTRFPEATSNRAKCTDCTYRKICPDGP